MSDHIILNFKLPHNGDHVREAARPPFSQYSAYLETQNGRTLLQSTTFGIWTTDIDDTVPPALSITPLSPTLAPCPQKLCIFCCSRQSPIGRQPVHYPYVSSIQHSSHRTAFGLTTDLTPYSEHY